MVKKIEAEINKVYFIEKYTLVHILKGSGNIQVDFENYPDWKDKGIYLEKGQYVKFLSDDFVVRFIDFPNEIMFNSKDVRVLFKHIISLGYIDFEECSDCQLFLSQSVFNTDAEKIIDISTEQWYWQNPFQAEKDEYQVIFDIKDIIDQEYLNKINSKKLIHTITSKNINVQSLIKNKLGITINTLINKKILLESQKDIAFSGKSIKEIAYEKGFKDPAYFNRVFKKSLGQTPKEFRHNFDYLNRDLFSQDITYLLRNFHKEEHSLQFYADKMNMSVKGLSKKVKLKMNMSLGQLIRNELINSAKLMLNQNYTVREIAFHLGFEEPNHLSSFFKHYTGVTPTVFIEQDSVLFGKAI